MDQRFGAWAQLITLFRLVYEGGQHSDFKIPPRKGYLFDPKRYPFLEGRGSGIGVGEWGIERTKHHEREFVSRPASLAIGHRPDGVLLSRDEDVSEGRDVRADESDPTRCQLNSGEHRGGTRARQEGISSVPENRAGQSNGTGNTLDHRTEGSDSPGLEPSTTFGDNGPIGTDANQTSTITSRLTQSPSPTPHPPIPSPHPQIPRIPDGVIYRVLRNLLILDGERLSYRTLDVEQIGSVYETVMGFNLEVAAGKSIAIKPTKSHGAPATINLDALLETKGKDRAKWLKDQSDQSLGTAAAKQLKDATTIDELLEALDKKIAKKVTPRVVPSGAIVLQPSDERRRSGSHYTPRSLTEPIVRTTLEPILKQLVGNTSTPRQQVNPSDEAKSAATHSLALRACIEDDQNLPAVYEPSREDKKRYTPGELQARIRLSEKAVEAAKRARQVGTPHPSQILDLKICDPAMGSGAFLVEACRQLGDELVKAWYAHDLVPTDIPPDEDEVLYARRLIAQRCLYGVDKNDMAVDLAKLSLWLVTLAKDHAFTFLDHALRHGDSLVGLTRRQIIGFHWEPKKQKQFGEDLIQKRLDKATEARAKILNAREDVPYRDQESRLALADEALDVVRLTGDACVSAFFDPFMSRKALVAGASGREKTPTNRDREARCEELFGQVSDWYASGHDINKRGSIAEAAAALGRGEHPIPAFHWEIEFPEVFSRASPGFDGFVGNPPFLGGTRISEVSGMPYFQYMVTAFPPCEHHCDLVAYFLRQAYRQLRATGCFGLIATNTVSQGDTREGGLATLIREGGHIYSARRRFRWPGQAAVIVSVVHVRKGGSVAECRLDGATVARISAYLMNGSADDSPMRLRQNPYFSLGSKIYGQGFLFADDDPNCTPLAIKDAILASHTDWNNRIRPYLIGEEINSHPLQQPQRFVVNLSDLQTEDQLDEFPELRDIVVEKVRPVRMVLGNNPNNTPLKKRWWAFQAHRPELYQQLERQHRVLCVSRVGQAMAFALVPADIVFSEQVVVFALESYAAFALLQSRPHESWARFLGSSMKDDLRYTPSDCFETFPFPPNWADSCLNECGRQYYEFRAQLLVEQDEGLTKTYNRFHDPHEKSTEIEHLRELHEAMDRAVLKAYGWDKLAKDARCEFLLDYEEEDEEEVWSQRSDVSKRKKRKPWRLRWPDDFRDEVLARLLELNEQRHQEELLIGEQTTKAAKVVKKKSQQAAKTKPKPKVQDAALFPTTLEREHRCLLMLLRAWEGRAVSRRILNAGMILMLDDKLRAALLSKGKVPAGKRRDDSSINQIFTELSIDRFVEEADSEHQQLWRVTAMAPKTDDASPEDVMRVEEVMNYLKGEMEAGKVTISEEAVDANVDLIPA